MKNFILCILILSSVPILALRYELGYNGVQTQLNAKAIPPRDLKMIRVIKGGGELKTCQDKGAVEMKIINDRPGQTGDACPEVIKLLKSAVFHTKGDTLVIRSMAGNCLGEVRGNSYKCMIDNL